MPRLLPAVSLTKFLNEWVSSAMIADVRVDITFATEALSSSRNVFSRVMMYIVGDKMAFGNNKEDSLQGCPAGPELKQASLGAGYSPNVVESDRPVFCVSRMLDVRNNHIEVGSAKRVAEHVAECDNFGLVNGAIVGQREGNDTWALLFFPELDGDRIKVGMNGLVAMALDVWEPSFWPQHELIFHR